MVLIRSAALVPANAPGAIEASVSIGSVAACSFEQPLNASAPIDSVPLAMTAVTSAVQPSNAPAPIDFTFALTVTVARLLQSLNAPAPIESRLPGMTSAAMLAPLNASGPIATTGIPRIDCGTDSVDRVPV
ncbi:MAG: hypothetical protein BWY81_01607 [Firmicutes bacterium ADurb.Bin467]|nr:MAG: hypothetical protein BWY81_01607 [Firmicutes bacterium ADurb.Bin467]